MRGIGETGLIYDVPFSKFTFLSRYSLNITQISKSKLLFQNLNFLKMMYYAISP